MASDRDIALGWRWCDAGHGHLWNTATTATALYPQPPWGIGSTEERCEWHRKKSAGENAVAAMDNAVARAGAIRERVRHAALTGTSMIISGSDAKLLLQLIQREM